MGKTIGDHKQNILSTNICTQMMNKILDFDLNLPINSLLYNISMFCESVS